MADMCFGGLVKPVTMSMRGVMRRRYGIQVRTNRAGGVGWIYKAKHLGKKLGKFKVTSGTVSSPKP